MSKDDTMPISMMMLTLMMLDMKVVLRMIMIICYDGVIKNVNLMIISFLAQILFDSPLLM